MSGNPNRDSIVSNPPVETVSCLRWSPTANYLCGSGWGREVRIWDVAATGQATPKLLFSQPVPILGCDWHHGGEAIIYGGCDGVVRLSSTTMENSIGSTTELGIHEAPVKSVIWNKTIHAAITGSWDKTIRFFDPRKSTKSSFDSKSFNCEVSRIKVGERVHAMDNRDHLLGVGLGDRTVVMYDLRNTKVPYREYLTPFLSQVSTSLVIFPDKRSFVLASIEGRVRIQDLESPDDQKMSFTFRAHKIGDFDAYSINSIAVTDAHDAFATAGSDGSYIFWNKDEKRWIKRFEPLPQPITATAFNRNGTIFAYATGNDWSHGIHKQNYHTQILLHAVTPNDTTLPPS